jgi:hypothetical protein
LAFTRHDFQAADFSFHAPSSGRIGLPSSMRLDLARDNGIKLSRHAVMEARALFRRASNEKRAEGCELDPIFAALSSETHHYFISGTADDREAGALILHRML